MISIRRLIASMLVGALLLLVSAAQASAQSSDGLDRALDGVELGLAAAADVVGEGDVVVVDERLIEALDVYEAWAAKHESSNRQGKGQGPANAQAVHEALLEREVPGQLKKDTGSMVSGLSGVYETLKGKSEEAKAAKENPSSSGEGTSSNNGNPNGDKSNNGKSDDRSDNGKSDDRSNNGKSDDARSDDSDSDDDDSSEDG